jgi:hypothetical protein
MNLIVNDRQIRLGPLTELFIQSPMAVSYNTSPTEVQGAGYQGWPAFSYQQLWQGATGAAKDNQRTNLLNHFVQQVQAGALGFPYQKFFRLPEATIIANFLNATVVHITTEQEEQLAEVPTDHTGKIYVVTGPYQLRSYYSKYGTFINPTSYLNPHTGIDEPTTILSPSHSYPNIDVLSDFFQEGVRMTGKKGVGDNAAENRSVAECWNDPVCLRDTYLRPALDAVTPEQPLNNDLLREIIYQQSVENTAFNLTWAKGLLEETLGLSEIAGKSWLDMSAGYGDRLIVAALLKMRYKAADPNTLLIPGHQRIIRTMGDPALQEVVPVGFEDIDLGTELFDISIISPPYFTLEIYNTAEGTQSVAKYGDDRTGWLTHFLFVSLRKIWDHLKMEGWLVLHLGDNPEIPLSEETNLFIESFLEGASWQGVIGVRNKGGMLESGATVGGYARPVWVWQKLPPGALTRHWQPAEDSVHRARNTPVWRSRSLFTMYPLTYQSYLEYLVGQYAPAFSQVKQSAIAALYQRLSNMGIDRSSLAAHFTPLLLWTIIRKHMQKQKPKSANLPIISPVSNDVISEATGDVIRLRGAQSWEAELQKNHTTYLVWRTSLTALFHKVAQQMGSRISYDPSVAFVDLWLTSLLEAQGEAHTINWMIAMLSITYKLWSEV